MNDSHFPLAGSVARDGLKRWQENLLVLLLYTLLTAALTYPALLFFRTKVPGGGTAHKTDQ